MGLDAVPPGSGQAHWTLRVWRMVPTGKQVDFGSGYSPAALAEMTSISRGGAEVARRCCGTVNHAHCHTEQDEH